MRTHYESVMELCAKRVLEQGELDGCFDNKRANRFCEKQIPTANLTYQEHGPHMKAPRSPRLFLLLSCWILLLTYPKVLGHQVPNETRATLVEEAAI